LYIYLQQIKGRTNAPTCSSPGKNTGCPLEKEETTQKIPNPNPNLNNPKKHEEARIEKASIKQ
jgi:hypothetical protein